MNKRISYLTVVAVLLAVLGAGDAARAQTIEVGPCVFVLSVLVQDIEHDQVIYTGISETFESEAHVRLRAEVIGRSGVWNQQQGLRTFYPSHRVMRASYAQACP